ncbi:MAG TPA: nuclear transport factor 2 family protein [Armatimonadota bacterium]|jgi:ketosteroid isomerase-like protein
MHKFKAFSLALMAAILTPAASRADDAAVRKQIEAQMARFQQAFRRKDVSAMRLITTPDFTMKSKDGVVTTRRAAEISMANELKSITEITKWTLKIEKIVVRGNVATLLVTENMKARLASETTGNGIYVNFARIRETWINTPDGWRYKRGEALDFKSAREGMSFVKPDEMDLRQPGYATTRKAIERQYAAYQRAIRNKDFAGVLATMTEDTTLLYPSGRSFSRKEIEAMLRGTMRATRSIPEWSLKILRLSVRGNSAVATIGERMVSNYADPNGLHKQTLVDFYHDTWVNTPKGWRLKSTVVSQGKVTVDGRTVDPFK